MVLRPPTRKLKTRCHALTKGHERNPGGLRSWTLLRFFLRVLGPRIDQRRERRRRAIRPKPRSMPPSRPAGALSLRPAVVQPHPPDEPAAPLEEPPSSVSP